MSRGTLYVVATPIGNLGDLSPRAQDVLRIVDAVAAEDTRRTRTLLRHASATPRLLSFHAHSPEGRLDQLAELLADGKSVALLTDAGTPAVSDPGEALIARAHVMGLEVVAVPGPSAVTAALSVSGLPADRYLFVGFLPRKGRARRDVLARVTASPWTTVIFESARRLVALLRELVNDCGPDRRAVVVRELTKVHDEVKSGTINELACYYQEHAPRGEVTVLIAGQRPVAEPVDCDAARARAREWLSQGLSRRDTASRVAGEFSMTRREAYRLVTEL